MNPFFENKKRIKILNEEIGVLHVEFELFRQNAYKRTDKKFKEIKKLEKQCTHKHKNGKSAMFVVKEGLTLHMRYDSADWEECRLCGHQKNTIYRKLRKSKK